MLATFFPSDAHAVPCIRCVLPSHLCCLLCSQEQTGSCVPHELLYVFIFHHSALFYPVSLLRFLFHPVVYCSLPLGLNLSGCTCACGRLRVLRAFCRCVPYRSAVDFIRSGDPACAPSSSFVYLKMHPSIHFPGLPYCALPPCFCCTTPHGSWNPWQKSPRQRVFAVGGRRWRVERRTPPPFSLGLSPPLHAGAGRGLQGCWRQVGHCRSPARRRFRGAAGLRRVGINPGVLSEGAAGALHGGRGAGLGGKLCAQCMLRVAN